MAGRDDEFLSRWSRRKVDARKGLKKKEPEERQETERSAGQAAQVAPAPVKSPETAPAAPVRQAAVAHETEAPTAATLAREQADDTVPVFQTPPARNDLEVEDEAALEAFKDVDFEKLNYATDYSRFMEKGVPDAIRRRALRMLWGSNPLLANIDGLNDYDEDFTDAALAIKIIGSNYKPGTGYLTEEERQASYSEEARKAGKPDNDEEPGPGEDIADADDIDDLDVEDFGDDEWDGEDRFASETGEGEDGPDKPTSGDDKA